MRLNHWCHMDYLNDVFTTFLGLKSVSCIAVYAGTIRKLSDFTNNILVCVPKINEGLTGLEQHKGE